MAALGFVLLESCSSGKGAFQHGDYYQAVITSANRLRRNDNHKKSAETLRQAYPLGITFYENQAASASGPFRWRSVFNSYSTLQSMYNEIQTSPGALKVIPNPKNYSAKLQEARENAAEESYSAGVIALNMGTRAKAREAHVLFMQVNEYVNGYKDVNQKIQDALWAATVKVLVEPIPAVARTYDVNAEFFNNRMAEQLQRASINDYVAFFTPSEVATRKIQPDHVVRLGFDEFSVGQIYMKETQIPMERDSLSKEAKPVNAASVAGGGNVRVLPPPSNPGTSRPVTSQPTTNPKPAEPQPTNPQPNPTPQTGGAASTPTTQPTPNTPVATTPSTPAVEQPKSQPVVTQPAQNPQPQPAANPQPTPQPSTHPTPATQPVANPTPVATPVTETKPEPAPAKNEPKEESIVICHVPPGNSGARKAMTVPRSALQAHLNHGDNVGECGEATAGSEKPGNANDRSADNDKAEREKLEKEKADREKMEKEKLEKEKADREKAEKEKLEKEKADREKAEKDKLEKEKAEREKAEKEKLEKEKADSEKAEKEKLEKEKADKEKAEKDKLEKEKAEKEKAEKEKLEKEKAEKEKLEKEKAEKEKANKEKEKKDNKKDNEGYALTTSNHRSLLAAASNDWWKYVADTSKVVRTYKATVRHFEKTITSKGVLDVKIIDSKTNAVLTQEKVPSEYIWKSEWVTYNGEEEALTAEQVKLSKQREVAPPTQQELFKQFTDPLLGQVIEKLKVFYRNY